MAASSRAIAAPRRWSLIYDSDQSRPEDIFDRLVRATPNRGMALAHLPTFRGLHERSGAAERTRPAQIKEVQG